MSAHPSLFPHEARSVWRDHRLPLAVLAVAPVVGAADYLMLASSLSYDTNFGVVAILTRALPALTMVVAYLIFKDIGGDATGSHYQVLPMSRRVTLGARFALLGAVGVLWPALIAAGVAAVTFPETCAEQASHFAVWNALGVAFGAFLGVRVSRALQLVAYLGLSLGGLSIATVVFGGGAKPPAFFPWLALIPPVIFAVFLWRTLVSCRALATRRVWCAELILVIAAVPLLAWSYSASIPRLIAGERPGPKVIVLPEVTGELRLDKKSGHGGGTYDGIRFANRAVGFPGLPKMPIRYVSTEGEWRVVDDAGTATPWRALSWRVRQPDAPVVQITYPDVGLFPALVTGDAEAIRIARAACFSPGHGAFGLELPDAFGPKATLPYSSLKDYRGKTIELRGKTVIRLCEYREVFRTKELQKKFRWTESGHAVDIKLSENLPKDKAKQPSVTMESEVAVLTAWLIDRKDDEWLSHPFSALAAGKVCVDTGFSSSGRSNKLATGQKGRRTFMAAHFVSEESPAVRPDTVVMFEESTGDTVIVPFRVTVKIPAEF